MKIKYLLPILVIAFSCKNNETVAQENKISSQANAYWYDGKAEISSYELTQARYGELRKGSAVLLFVTETFSEKTFAKADNPTSKDIPVMKLNFMKNFTTGVYPYSMMNSTFFPMKGGNSLKLTSSSQEWCGHTFMELKNKTEYEVSLQSYFEGEAFTNLKVAKAWLEDDFWTMIRLNPESLPAGKTKVIPSFFSMRLLHKDFAAVDCEISKKTEKETTTYIVSYPELKRTLSIVYENEFPFQILSWEETYPDGFNKNPKILTTSGKLLKTIKSDYWNKNSNSDSKMRKELDLEK
jgi:hypothetical protein